jgi:hypothetical protein
MDPVQQLHERRLVLLEDAAHGVFLLTELSPSGAVDLRPLAAAVTPPDGRVVLSEELSAADRKEVAQICRSELKDGKFDERTLKAIKAALTSLFKTLYTRREFWRGDLSLNASS